MSLPPTVKSLFKLISNPPLCVNNLHGWVKSVRLLKKVAFIDLQDGTTSKPIKLVIPREANDSLKQLRTGQSLHITNANWKQTPSREQSFELEALPQSVRIIGDVPDTYPLQKKYHSLSFLRSLPTLKHRSNYLGALLRFRSHVENSFASFFESQDFTKVSPPILTSSDCEGAGELFRVESNSKIASKELYFGKPTYLTVSTQLHLEIMAMALSRCWTLSPSFRAEESDTNRHLAEFWMLEAELCFINDVRKLSKFTESMLKYVIRSCLQNKDSLLPAMVPQENTESLDNIAQRWEAMLLKEWPILSYTETIKLLQERHKKVAFKFPPSWGNALQTEHEKWLADSYNSPVFVVDYPRECKAFYMKQNKDDTVACFDLLVPQMGEIIGGSIREDDYERILQEMERRKMNTKDLEWYTSLRKQGSAPHGGFGLGLERFVSWMFGSQNVRDAIPFHRSADGVIDL